MLPYGECKRYNPAQSFVSQGFMMKTFRVLAMFAAAAGVLLSQTNRGGISGTVLDSSGSVVPNATVTIRNLGTNQVTKEKTSASGAYNVVSLDPVTYSVTVEADGFKKATIESIKVDTATVATINVTLQAGLVSTEITVHASAAQINTESGATSTTVTARQIRDLPLVNRSVLDLALTQPNVSGSAGSEDAGLSADATVPGFNLSVNGSRPGSNMIMADGVNNTGVSLGRAMVSFSPETVQEFTIQTSAFSAEFSQSGGGILNATTKSGTNELRGTALWYVRNPYFNAAPWTTATINRPPPTLKYNQFSLAAGGPVYVPKVYNGKNRTFFFGAIEPRYRRDFLPQDASQPTAAMLSGDFSGLVNTSAGLVPTAVAKQFNLAQTGDATIYQVYNLTNGNQFLQNPAPAVGTTYLPFPGNVIPKTWLNTTALKAVPYMTPAGNYYLNSAGGISNLFNPRLLSQDDKRYTLRIDQIITAKNQLNFRFTDTPLVKLQYTPASITSQTGEYSLAKQYMLADTHVFSPTVSNDLRVGVTQGNFSSTKAPQWEPFTGANLNTELGLPNITPGGVPALGVGGFGSSNSTEGVTHEYRFSVNDIVYVSRGKMNWKFGGEFDKSFENVKPLYGASGGVYTFSANQTNSTGGAAGGVGGSTIASFLLGVPSAVTLRNTLIPYYYRWTAGAVFAQNDWKVKPNLTLNLGLRYTLNMPRTEKYDRQGAFLPDLARTFPLAAPLTLQNGAVVSSAVVPPFAFSNKGGRSRYLYDPDYKDFEPRFGFAWSPDFLRTSRVTLRGGYGLSHAPLTGAARLPQPDFGTTSSAYNPTTGAVDPNYIMRLGENPPKVVTQSPEALLNIPQDGLVYLGSINYQGSGFAISQNVHTPYSQNWNFTIAWQAEKNTAVEIAYVGNKGTHLFLASENINPKDFSLLRAQTAANISTTTAITDPLGRKTTTGANVTVQNGSLGSPYLGFSTLVQRFDASGNSIRHAGYVNVNHQVGRGLSFSTNYTYGKTIDDASDSGIDKFVSNVGRVDGQVALGGTRKNDRSVATFDQRHIFNTTFNYDLPFGRGRKLLAGGPNALDLLFGGWTLNGVSHIASGYPATATMSDTNLLGDLTHTSRPNLVAGALIVNPLWTRDCPVGANCQPYLNLSAFERPPLGQLGNAPRTLDGARGPWQRTFDVSLQKSFKIGEKRSVQLRFDALNVFNHPIFKTYPNAQNGTDIFSQPSGNSISAAEYATWAAANGKPASTTPEGVALLAQSNAVVNAYRNSAGALPVDFFTIPLPANFYGKTANSFDITTVDGFKDYRLRNALITTTGMGGGQIHQFGQSRYLQLGLKLYF